jgi:hypothetical protein
MKKRFLILSSLLLTTQALATGGITCNIQDEKVKAEVWGETARMPGSPLVSGLKGSIEASLGLDTNALTSETEKREVGSADYTQYFNYNNLGILLQFESNATSNAAFTLVIEVPKDVNATENEDGVVIRKGTYSVSAYSKEFPLGNSFSGEATCINE